MKKRLNFFVKLAIMVIVAVAVIMLVKMNMSLNELQDEIVDLDETKKKQDLYIEDLNDSLNSEISESVIKRIAKEKYGYYEKGIILIMNDIPN